MENNKSLFNTVVDITIRLGFLLLLVGWCINILAPFLMPVVWGVVIAVSVEPLYLIILKKVNGKSKIAVTAIMLCLLLLVLVPSTIFLGTLIDGLAVLKEKISNDVLILPTPNESVKVIPVIGDSLFKLWEDVHQDFKGVVTKYNKEIKSVSLDLLGGALSFSSSFFQIIFSIIISGILLGAKGTNDLSVKFFKKIVGDRATEFVELSTKTVQNVTKGVLGVALLQGVLLGLGFVLADVPYAGLWALVSVILAVVQVPVILIVLPVAVYLYNVDTVLIATCWSIYFVLVSLVDNVLKPIVLGDGAGVPMLVVFLGSLGGFVMSGFLGLFTGAIILSLGFKLFMAWLNDQELSSEIEK